MVFFVTRHLANGELDPSFSEDGLVFVIVNKGNRQFEFCIANAIQLAPDGKIVVAGQANGYNRNSTLSGIDYDYFTPVVRLNADGTLDNSFDGDGIAQLNTGSATYPQVAASLVVQSNKKIVLNGYAYNSSFTANLMTLTRLNENGSLDNSFNGNGIVRVNFNNQWAEGYGIKLQPDGKIAACGKAKDNNTYTGIFHFAVVRLNADGSYDNSFDGDGRAIHDIGGTDNSAAYVALQQDGKIVLGGGRYNYNNSRTSEFAVVRLNTNGSIDHSFNGNGIQTVSLGGNSNVCSSVAIQQDGSIFLGGMSNALTEGNSYEKMALVKLNSDGSLDNSFDGDGKALYTFGGQWTSVTTSIALQGDGKILMTGNADNRQDIRGRALVRVLQDGISSSLSAPDNQVANADACNAVVNNVDATVSPLGSPYSYTLSGATTGSGSGSVSGMAFNIGITTVTYRLNADATKTASFTINVKDVTPPVFSCPSPHNLPLTTSCSVLIPDFISDLSAADCSSVTFEQFPAAGTSVPSAHNLSQNVLIRAKDAAGNVTECTVMNISKDVTPPTITCTSDVVKDTDPLQCGALVTYTIPTISDNCPGVVTESNVPSGSFLAPGVYTVNWKATDAGGNIATCSFKITIKDAEIPSVNCAISGITQRLTNTSANKYKVQGEEFDATASDNCGATLLYTLSGATTGNGVSLADVVLNQGTTVISWSAKDVAGNSINCNFSVLVGSNTTSNISAVILDAFAYTTGVNSNTIYRGWTPASKITYTASVTSGQPSYSYNWSADAGLSIVSTNYTPTVQVTSTTPGIYTLRCEVTDGNGQRTTINKSITVVDVRCGKKLDMVVICHIPPGNPGNPNQNCLSPNAVATHLRNGSTLGFCSSSAVLTRSAPQEEMLQSKALGLVLRAIPNPSYSHFNITVKGDKEKGRVFLKVVNMLGQVVETRSIMQLDEVISLGEQYKPGTYLIEVLQGEARLQVKVIKM
jgi:uncharacterized delta-60 repeat protein